MFHAKHVTTRLTRVAPVAPRWSRRNLLTLAIETSCDDTCVAILEKPSVLDGEKVSSTSHPPSQAAATAAAKLHFNKKITLSNNGWEGIHPLEALDSHRANLAKLVSEALGSLPLASAQGSLQSQLVLSDGSSRVKPDFVSATRGPGMRSNLSCGLDVAKGLAVAWAVPFVGVHHMQAHALTPRLVHAMQHNSETQQCDGPSPAFPFLTLLVSGGHTMLLHSTDLISHQILATTRDTAIGDALDKCGRLILPQGVKDKLQDSAFGKHLSQFAFPSPADFERYVVPHTRGEEIDKALNKYGWQMQTPLSDTRTLAFSFAGILSEAVRIHSRRLMQYVVDPDERLCLAQTCLGTAFEHLGSRTIIALESLQAQGTGISSLVVSGGVAANDFLRYYLRTMLDLRGFQSVQLIFPPVSLCTDNAAMIAWCGMEMFEAGYASDLGVHPLRKWSMDAQSPDGGILGVGGWDERTG